MANWTVTSNTFTAAAGASITNQTVVLTISPTNGYIIQASNFIIGNGTESSSGSGIWTTGAGSWNADAGVTQVQFENNTTLIDGNNTVKVTVKITDGDVGSSSANYYIDIDELSTDPPLDVNMMPFCLKFGYWNFYNHSVTGVATIAPMTVTNNAIAGDVTILNSNVPQNPITPQPTHPVEYLTKGTVPQGEWSIIADTTFTIDSNAVGDGDPPNPNPWYFGSDPTIVEANMPWGFGLFQSNYSLSIVDHVYNSSNQLTSFRHLVKYFPPPGPSEDNVPMLSLIDQAGICAQNHLTQTNMEWFQAPNPGSINDIDDVIIGNSSEDDTVPHTGGEHEVVVVGKSGAKYSIRVEQSTSLTNGVTVASGFYNWSKNKFDTAANVAAGEVNREFGKLVGKSKTHYVMFPPVSDDTRYDVFIDLVDKTGKAVKGSKKVPTKSGDKSIIQHGTRVLTLSCVTGTAGDFGTLPANVAITRPYKYEGNSYNSAPLKSTFSTGGTAGVSSTRLVLDRGYHRVTRGMLVTGSGVTHGATVANVKDNIITLSAASTIANNTNIRFDLNNGRLAPFTFTVVENAGGDNLTLRAGVDLKSKIGGFDDVLVQTNGTTSASTTVELDSNRGILPGMIVGTIGLGSIYEGKYYNASTSGVDNTVVSVNTNGTTIVVSKPLSLLADDLKFFVSGEKSTYATGFDLAKLETTNNPGVSIVDMKAVATTATATTVIITGYIDVATIDATLTHPIYIDDIIASA